MKVNALCKHCNCEFKKEIKVGYQPLFCSDDCAFFFKVKKTKSCWEWIGAKTLDGYGCFVRKPHYRATRYIYTKTYGKISKGLCVCHRCDNPSCVNPRHLFLGTHQENMTDMKNKKRYNPPCLKGERNPASKLKEKDVIEIIKSDLHPNDLAKTYKIAWQTVYKIKSGKIWKNTFLKENNE